MPFLGLFPLLAYFGGKTGPNSLVNSKVFDFRVYNRNKDKLYYGLGTAVDGASSGNTIEVS